MRYGSVCSGIEAATVAWHPLGWDPAWFAEIEKFPSAVLAHHYPTVPNLGDMNGIGEQHGPVELLVGGTPCQSFSVAGLRRGMDDPRGNLALIFLRLVRDLRPRWVLWENVPGVLSSNGGRDFGSFVGGLAELGYGWAYRVLDAQFFGVAQRRRRVFVVGRAGGQFQRAAAVLFEPSCLRGDPAPRREAGQRAAPCVSASLGHHGRSSPRGDGSDPIVEVAGSLGTRGNKSHTELDGHGACVPVGVDFQNCEATGDVCGTLMGEAQAKGGQAGHGLFTQEAFWGGRSRGALDVSTACNAHSGRQDFESETLVAIPFDTTQITSAANYSSPQAGDPAHPLAAGAHPPAIAFSVRGREGGAQAECELTGLAPALRAGDGGSSRGLSVCAPAFGFAWQQGGDGAGTMGGMEEAIPAQRKSQVMAVHHLAAVRRLTPRECARLQGFPDTYLDIPGATDSGKYRALGNSMAVPVMNWLGRRIQMVDEIEEMP